MNDFIIFLSNSPFLMILLSIYTVLFFLFYLVLHRYNKECEKRDSEKRDNEKRDKK